MSGSGRYDFIIEAIERNLREGSCRPIPRERVEAMEAALERLRGLAEEEKKDGREG